MNGSSFFSSFSLACCLVYTAIFKERLLHHMQVCVEALQSAIGALRHRAYYRRDVIPCMASVMKLATVSVLNVHFRVSANCDT